MREILSAGPTTRVRQSDHIRANIQLRSTLFMTLMEIDFCQHRDGVRDRRRDYNNDNNTIISKARVYLPDSHR